MYLKCNPKDLTEAIRKFFENICEFQSYINAVAAGIPIERAHLRPDGTVHVHFNDVCLYDNFNQMLETYGLSEIPGSEIIIEELDDENPDGSLREFGDDADD